jgi:hypothetical protein
VQHFKLLVVKKIRVFQNKKILLKKQRQPRVSSIVFYKDKKTRRNKAKIKAVPKQYESLLRISMPYINVWID